MREMDTATVIDECGMEDAWEEGCFIPHLAEGCLIYFNAARIRDARLNENKTCLTRLKEPYLHLLLLTDEQ